MRNGQILLSALLLVAMSYAAYAMGGAEVQALYSSQDPTTRLGGLDLQSYCQKNYDSNAELLGWTPYDWRCGMNSLNVKDACRQKYGRGARAAYDDFDDPSSWYCLAD
jgi:hypothetical protein